MRQFDPIFFTPPTGITKRPRTLHKGGGGGDGGAAERAEAERQRVAQATRAINQIFGVDPTPVNVDRNKFMTPFQAGQQVGEGYEITTVPVANQNNQRFTTSSWNGQMTPNIMSGPISGLGIGQIGSNQPQNRQMLFNRAAYEQAIKEAEANRDRPNQQREELYGKISQDFTNNAMLDLNRERGLTERELNFILARQGLSGGSRDVDANKDVLDEYNRGALQATNFGIQAANNARSADDRTRTNLIASIQAGLDGSQAQQQALEGMRNNARQAQDEANTASLGGFFNALRQQQQQAAFQQGYQQSVQPFLQSRNPMTSSTRGSYGGTTRTI